VPRKPFFSEKVELACFVATETGMHIREAGMQVDGAAITVFDPNELKEHDEPLMVVIWEGDPTKYETYSPDGRELKCHIQSWHHDNLLRKADKLIRDALVDTNHGRLSSKVRERMDDFLVEVRS